jgi:ATP/maltotriose-dependent transcriptional regulator MalT
VPREELQARLEACRHLPLRWCRLLAGDDKSTLISHRLETGDAPDAWLSLDETDSE